MTHKVTARYFIKDFSKDVMVRENIALNNRAKAEPRAWHWMSVYFLPNPAVNVEFHFHSGRAEKVPSKIDCAPDAQK